MHPAVLHVSHPLSSKSVAERADSRRAFRSYPPLLHLKLAHLTARQRFMDWVMVAFGAVVAVYTTYQTLSLMIASGKA